MASATTKAVPPPLPPMPAQESVRWLWLLSGSGVGGLLVLYFFNPVQYAFYPVCQFYQLTHLHCPGCGSLRALHQFTHGHVLAAFCSNPLLITSLPLLVWWGFRKMRRAPNSSANPALVQPAVAWIIFGVVIAFGILRNLPGPAFAWMSP